MSVPDNAGAQLPGLVPSSVQPTVPPKNSLATASLVLGIVSIVTSLVFLPALVGLALGIAGLVRARRDVPPTGTGKAVAGIVLSGVSLLIGAGIVSAMTGGDDAGPEAAPPTVEQETAPTEEVPADQTEEPSEPEADAEASGALPGVGDPARDGKFEFVVTDVERGVERIGDEYFGEEAQGQFVLVHLTVENIGDRAQYFDGGNVSAFDEQGREFATDGAAAIYLDDSNSFLNEINPGNVVEGVVVFDVPTDLELVRLELHDSAFSGGTEVTLR